MLPNKFNIGDVVRHLDEEDAPDNAYIVTGVIFESRWPGGHPVTLYRLSWDFSDPAVLDIPEDAIEMTELTDENRHWLQQILAWCQPAADPRAAWQTFVSMMAADPIDCICVDPPHAGGNDDGKTDQSNPSHHSKYCWIYLEAYAVAMAADEPPPE